MILAIKAENPQCGKDTVGRIWKIINFMIDNDMPYSPAEVVKQLELNSKNGLNNCGWEVAKFAKKLKESCEHCFPEEFSEERWENEGDEYRNGIMPSLGMTRRQLLERYGDGMRQIVHPEYWVKALLQDYIVYDPFTNVRGEGSLPNWIITDMRYANEMKEILKAEPKAIIVYLTRKAAKNSDAPGEQDFEIPFGYQIDNNGTLEELVESVKALYDEIYRA